MDMNRKEKDKKWTWKGQEEAAQAERNRNTKGVWATWVFFAKKSFSFHVQKPSRRVLGPRKGRLVAGGWAEQRFPCGGASFVSFQAIYLNFMTPHINEI